MAQCSRITREEAELQAMVAQISTAEHRPIKQDTETGG